MGRAPRAAAPGATRLKTPPSARQVVRGDPGGRPPTDQAERGRERRVPRPAGTRGPSRLQRHPWPSGSRDARVGEAGSGRPEGCTFAMPGPVGVRPSGRLAGARARAVAGKPRADISHAAGQEACEGSIALWAPPRRPSGGPCPRTRACPEPRRGIRRGPVAPGADRWVSSRRVGHDRRLRRSAPLGHGLGPTTLGLGQ